MNLLYRNLFAVVLVNFVWVQAYTPVTMLNKISHLLYAPLCVADVLNEKKTSVKRPLYFSTNVFAIAGTALLGPEWYVHGVAMQAHVPMDFLHSGLYGKAYMPILSAHAHDCCVHHKTSGVADFQCVIGKDIIKREKICFSGYLLGIKLAGKNVFSYRDHDWLGGLFGTCREDKITSVRFTNLDSNISLGLGCDCSIRLLGNTRHHLDGVFETDVIFKASHKSAKVWNSEAAVVRVNGGTLWQGICGMVYQYKYFVSDFGMLYALVPSRNCLLLDKKLTSVSQPYNHRMDCLSVYLDLGCSWHTLQRPTYITLGFQYSEPGLALSLKMGMDF